MCSGNMSTLDFARPADTVDVVICCCFSDQLDTQISIAVYSDALQSTCQLIEAKTGNSVPETQLSFGND